MPQRYTLAEANALLPAIIPQLEELRRLAEQITTTRQELEAISPTGRRNGQANHAMRLETQMTDVTRQAESLMRELLGMGVEVKDPHTGLIDFRSLRDGQEVYLCWRLGEGAIAWWHELDAGFRGRRPI